MPQKLQNPMDRSDVLRSDVLKRLTRRKRSDVLDRLGEAPVRKTIHPQRTLGPVNQTVDTASRDLRRRAQARKSGVLVDVFDVFKINTVPLACLPTTSDEAESPNYRSCSRHNKNNEWSKAISKWTVLNHVS